MPKLEEATRMTSIKPLLSTQHVILSREMAKDLAYLRDASSMSEVTTQLQLRRKLRGE